ncbi:MAG TPA: serine--tRNA ligase [Candidatus Diapherotrites archaeon]|nr:serine--tRNA ligase [Candidatus Diapherotrites archaeon]
MIDIKYIRENKELVKQNVQKKFQESKLPLVDKLYDLDKEYRENIQIANQLKHRKNEITEMISIRKRHNQPIDDLLKEVNELPSKIKEFDDKQKQLKQEIDKLQNIIPNLISEQTPIGKDSSQNKPIAYFGEPKKFDFEIVHHGELAQELNVLDIDSARNVSGKGFFYLKGDLALLNNALIRFTEDFLNKKGYTFILTPYLLNQKAMEGAVDFEFFRDMIYKIENEDLYLIGTAEHSLMAMFSDKVIPEQKLPIKVYSYSSCFRKEIGSHGLDERGLFRVHQFDKVEQVIICKPEDSEKMYDELLNNSIELFKQLGLPTRVLEICSGDMGDLKYRSADLEAWSPRKQEYIEVGSCSNLTNAQALKLNIKASTPQGEKYHVHTLNNTAIATSRALVAILENCQTKEGTIKIPDVLVPYMYGKKEIKKNNSF